MLYMVIERYPLENEKAISERFRAQGRMMPDDVAYVASWIEDGGRCFQLMEAPCAEALDPWIAQWSDLVEFEVVPVMTSQDYWAKRGT